MKCQGGRYPKMGEYCEKTRCVFNFKGNCDRVLNGSFWMCNFLRFFVVTQKKEAVGR